MSQLETSVGGNPLRTINAENTDETYQLPNMAAGRSVTIRREDSAASGNAVTITVPAGHYLDGVLNGTASLPGNVEVTFRATNPGTWETYGLNSGGITGFGGASVTTTTQIASDPALTGVFAPIGAAGYDGGTF